MLPETLDLKKLKTFLLVAQHGNLGAVAARLGLTIPAVSIQIKRLEEELGTQLFRRLPNGLILTTTGEQFAREVDGVFEKVESALATLPSKAPARGHLSIATSSDVTWYLAPRISTFIKRNPAIQLRYAIYHSNEIIDQMNRGDLDIGVGYFGFGYFVPPPKGLQREVIAQTTLSLICAVDHPLMRRRHVRLEDIAKYKVLVPPQRYRTRKVIDSAFQKAKAKLDDIIEVENCLTARDFAEKGAGVAIVHSICMGHKFPESLRRIPLGRQFKPVEFSVVYRKDSALNPAVAGFLEALTDKDAD